MERIHKQIRGRAFALPPCFCPWRTHGCALLKGMAGCLLFKWRRNVVKCAIPQATRRIRGETRSVEGRERYLPLRQTQLAPPASGCWKERQPYRDIVVDTARFRLRVGHLRQFLRVVLAQTLDAYSAPPQGSVSRSYHRPSRPL